MKAALCLLVSSIVLGAPAQETRFAEAAGRVAAMTLVKTDDLTSVAWHEERIDLKRVSSVVKKDSNVYMLLQGNGIAPDSEALALVYDLNPRLKDANKLVANTSITLPSVTGDSNLLQLLQNGYLVELTLDPGIWSELNRQIDSLQGLLPLISHLDLDPEAQTQIERLIAWYQQIGKRYKRRTAPPLRQASLIELQDEARQLLSILLDVVQQHHNLSSTERKQIVDIYDDIELEMKQFGETLAGFMPKPQAFYVVTVDIKGARPSLLDRLRVYYTYNGLFRALPASPPIPSFGFKQLGSGKSENLLMKNYKIWAARDGDSNHPVTAPYLLRIEDTAPSSMSVDLTLVPGLQP